MEKHSFTPVITDILSTSFGDVANELFERSLLLQYINLKTKSADRGSKSRSSFANLYAIYVIIEDYLNNGYDKKAGYNDYEGAQFAQLLKRQRELPFGGKLQNHALNNRMNAEFQKFFPTNDLIPILRNLETNRYWINANLIEIETTKGKINIGKAIIEIIDEYIKTKQNSFNRFIATCEELQTLDCKTDTRVFDFIDSLLAPNADARLFEIVSFSILKNYYRDQKIIWGFDYDNLNEENLKLYKTGRTNANDGGIDFVMKPLGRFFQVTETLDFKKYFLDIEKIERYPLSFVIKSLEPIENLYQKLRQDALRTYFVKAVVEKYMGCIEEIINIFTLKEYLIHIVKLDRLTDVMEEIIVQSRVEFNIGEDEIGEDEEEKN